MWRPWPSSTETVMSLRIGPEADALPPIPIEELQAGGDAPARAEAISSLQIPSDVASARLAGKLGGAPCPAEHDGSHGAFAGEIDICRVADALYAPEHGVVMDRTGLVYGSASGEAVHRWPDLSGLPGASPGETGTELRLSTPPPEIAAAAIFQPWGGGFNYGHFLLDALPSLLVLDEFGLLGRYPPIAPRLSAWRRDLIRLAFGDDPPVVERPEPFLHIRRAVYATSMDHFLHRPNDILRRLRERILSRAPPRAGRGRRLYLSRRGTSMRVMLDEMELETALKQRGFTIVHPERLTVADQVAMFREAEVVVGPTGAGLANALFAAPSAKIFEILPLNFASHWVRAMRHVIDGDWYGYFCASPVPEREVAAWRRMRRGFSFGYRTDVPAFLAFLDARL